MVAIVVPDEDEAKKWASDIGDFTLKGLDLKALCQSEFLRKTIMDDMRKLAKSNGLHGSFFLSLYTTNSIFLTP